MPDASGLSLRPIRESDRPFLARLYASTRTEELAVVPWPQEQKDAFLSMQFEAQHRSYQEQFAGARFDVVELEGRAIGRLYVERRADEIRVIDVALLPEHRGAGLGSQLLGRVVEEAREARLPVRLHVEPSNPAARLYRRMGFVIESEARESLYQLMVLPVRTGK